jgi:hypothetical protein
MNLSLRVSCVVFGLVLSIAGGCGSSDGDVGASCQKGCETAATLKCAMETMASCMSECQTLAANEKCKSQFAALINCSAARPASDFECGADGKSGLKDGICEAEGEAALMCLLGS